jgi:DNA repair exonuclease SbcCD ATPase subunit
MKFLHFCLLISFVYLQNKPSIKIGEMENNQCSTDIGRLNYKFMLQYTTEEVINSYFLLNMKDQNNEKRAMICKIELGVNKENGKNGTETDPDKDKGNDIDKPKDQSQPKENEKDLPKENEKAQEKDQPKENEKDQPKENEKAQEKDQPKENEKDQPKENEKEKDKPDEKLLDAECKKLLDDTKEQLKDLIKDTKLEEVANKIKEFQENIEKEGLSEDLKKLFDGVKKVANGLQNSPLGKRLGLDISKIKEIYELMDSNHIFEGNQEIMIGLSGISLKLLKKSFNKDELEEKVKDLQKNYQSIKDFILKIQSLYQLSKFISKLKVMNESIKLFPETYKFIVYKGIYKTIKNFLFELDISKIRDEIKSMDLPDNIKEIVGKFDFLGQIGENIQKIFKGENIQEIIDSKEEIKKLLDNVIHAYTDNTSLQPLVEKLDEIRSKVEEKIDLKESATKIYNLIQSAKQLQQSINDAKEKLTLDHIIESIRETDISELQQKINEPIDEIAEKVKERLNDEDVKLIFEKLKKVAQSKTLEEVNKSLEELKDTLKELKDKNKGDKFGKLKDIFEEIKAKVKESELLGDFKELSETVKSYGEKLDSLFGNIVKNSLDETSESIKENIEKAKTKLKDSMDKLKEKVKENLAEIKPFSDKFKEIYESDDFDELKMHIKELQDLIMEMKDKLPENSKLNQIFDKIIKKIEEKQKSSEFIDQLKKYITDIKALKTDYQSAKDKLKDGNKEEVKEKIKEVLEEYQKKAEEKTKEISEKLKNEFMESKLVEAVKPYSELLDKFKENIKNLFETETEPKINKLKELLSDPEKLKTSLESDLKNFGESIKNYNAEFISEVKEAIKDSDINKELENIKAPFEDIAQKLKEIKKQMSEKDLKDILQELNIAGGKNVNLDKMSLMINSTLNDIADYMEYISENIIAEINDSKFLETIRNYKKLDNNLIEQLKNISATSPTFKEEIEEIINELKNIDSEKVLKELSKLNTKIDEKLTTFTEKMNENLEKVIPLINEFAYVIANLTGINKLPAHNATLNKLLDILPLINFTLGFEELKKDIEVAKKNLTDKIMPLLANNQTFGKLAVYVDALDKYVKELKELQKPNFTEAIDEFADMVKYYKISDEQKSKFKQKLKYIYDEFKSQLETIKDNLNDKTKELLFYDELKEAFASIGDAVKQLADSDLLKPEDFSNELKELSNKILGLKKESLEKVFEEYFDFKDVKSYAEKIEEFFKGLKDLLNKDKESKTLEQIAKDCQEYIKNFNLDEIKPKEDLKEFIKTLVEKIKETEIYKQYEDYKDKYQDYKDLIKDMNLYIKDYTINGTVDKVRDFVKEHSLENLKNKCADLIEELKNKINDNEKAELVKEKVEALFKCKTIGELETALGDLKKTILEICKEQTENSKLKSLIDKVKELAEKHKEDIENSETYKSIKEYNQTISDFKGKIGEIVNNMGTHTWGNLKEGIKKGFDKFKEDLIEFSNTIEDKLQFEDWKAVKEKVKEIMHSKTIGELVDHNKELKQILKDIVSKYAGETKLKKNVDKIKEFNQKVHDKIIELAPLEPIKEVASSLQDVIDDMKGNVRNIQIYTIDSTITEIKNKLSDLPKKIDDKLKNVVDNLPKMVDSLEKVQEKLSNLNQTKLNMCIKRQINKATSHGSENNLRVLEESDLLCKYDDVPSEDLTLTASSSDLSILKNETYSLSLNSELSLSVKRDLSKSCNVDHIQTMKKQLSFQSLGTITKQTAKKRIMFKIKINIKRSFKVTNFFYIKMRIKVRYQKSSLLRQLEDEESDSFCIPGDNEDLSGEEADLDCFTMLDNPDNVEDIGNFTSDNIDIPENATKLSSSDNNSGDISNSKDNSNDGNNNNSNENDGDKNSTNLIRSNRAFYRNTSGNLSAGAIVGIILGCVAALVVMIVLVYLLKRKNIPKNITDSTKTDSNFNLKI